MYLVIYHIIVINVNTLHCKTGFESDPLHNYFWLF